MSQFMTAVLQMYTSTEAMPRPLRSRNALNTDKVAELVANIEALAKANARALGTQPPLDDLADDPEVQRLVADAWGQIEAQFAQLLEHTRSYAHRVEAYGLDRGCQRKYYNCGSFAPASRFPRSRLLYDYTVDMLPEVQTARDQYVQLTEHLQAVKLRWKTALSNTTKESTSKLLDSE